MAIALKHDELMAKRDAKGRFLPGHKPPKSPGRPPGPNGTKARAARIASENLEEMLGLASNVIRGALEDGNVQVATWLIDRVRPPNRSDTVIIEDLGKLDTLNDIIAASEATLQAVAAGRMSLQDANAFLVLLTRHAEMKGVEAIDELHARQDDLKASLASKKNPRTAHYPKWCKALGEGESLSARETGVP